MSQSPDFDLELVERPSNPLGLVGFIVSVLAMHRRLLLHQCRIERVLFKLVGDKRECEGGPVDRAIEVR